MIHFSLTNAGKNIKKRLPPQYNNPINWKPQDFSVFKDSPGEMSISSKTDPTKLLISSGYTPTGGLAYDFDFTLARNCLLRGGVMDTCSFLVNDSTQIHIYNGLASQECFH